uniref:Sodium-coupled monocarboxylate transporter 2 n=1 Tax=Megaselia scalaris TaxID=36166 RepID=T1GVG3_MEGSC
MYVSVLVVVIIGTISIGGPGVVFDIANRGDRLVFADVNASVYKRYSFWSVIIGGFFYWTGFNSVNQTMVQRYLSLPTKKKAQGSVLIFTVGMAVFLSVCCYTGLLVYAFYEKCDPMKAGLVTKTDQILPLYVMQTIGKYPGLPGLFIAGVFGAALSSLILKGTFRLKIPERASKWVVKGCIVVLGIVSLGLVFVIEKLGNVLQVATTLTSISAACTFGMFSLGMLVPFSNNIGAIAGTICGYIISAWIAFGTSAASAHGKLHSQTLPVSVEECPANITIIPDLPEPDESEVFPLYRLSYMWLTMIGFLVVMVVGTVTSLLTGPRKIKDIDPDLISPVLHRCLPKEVFMNEVRTKDFLTRKGTSTTLVQPEA